MGTRSLTKIYQDDKLLLSLYKQFDGYIKNGWGDALKEFIKSKEFINGAGDFALQKEQFLKLYGDLYGTS